VEVLVVKLAASEQLECLKGGLVKVWDHQVAPCHPILLFHYHDQRQFHYRDHPNHQWMLEMVVQAVQPNPY